MKISKVLVAVFVIFLAFGIAKAIDITSDKPTYKCDFGVCETAYITIDNDLGTHDVYLRFIFHYDQAKIDDLTLESQQSDNDGWGWEMEIGIGRIYGIGINIQETL